MFGADKRRMWSYKYIVLCGHVHDAMRTRAACPYGMGMYIRAMGWADTRSVLGFAGADNLALSGWAGELFYLKTCLLKGTANHAFRAIRC